MRTDLFDFELPRELIAQHPISPRDAARLLLVGERLRDCTLRDLPDLLRPGDILICNDTKVIPARLTGRRGAAKVEVTLHKEAGPGCWRAFARPAKRLRPGDRIDFAPKGSEGDFAAEVRARQESGEVELAFDREGAALLAALERHGAMPLPPYIRRAAGPDPHDRADYQTIFARHEGAVAAPTAGLHFTPALLQALEARGVRRATVTLHVGAGTFLPVKSEQAEDHRMHSEHGIMTAEAAASIEAARAAGGRVVAVGTTVLRLLEAAAGQDGRLGAFEGDIELFILPGYRFRVIDLLLTNFHLPRSTLFMLVCAFAGLERMQAAYAHAKAAGYRFYSYGDCCLLERAA
ncbi:MAG: tRNA preQ1(34) S-adenosylmethionine ribosyltransferase-isomerase QueA [Kiloniellales bacterium]